MQSKAKTFAAYTAELSTQDGTVIRALDGIVRAAAPKATFSMRFGMPTYDLADRYIAINSQKNYYSFYATPEIVKRYRSELKGLDCGRCCIRFRNIEDVSLATLGKIARDSLKGT